MLSSSESPSLTSSRASSRRPNSPRRRPGRNARPKGLALLFTIGALAAFLIEMLLASRALRNQANYASEVGETHERAEEGVGEPPRGEPG